MNKSTKKYFLENDHKLSIHSYEELAALHAIAKILAQPTDLRDELEQILHEMSSRLGMQRGMISLFDRDKNEIWLDIAHDVNIEGLDVTYKPGEGITGEVAQTGTGRNWPFFVFPLFMMTMLLAFYPPTRLRVK